MNIDAVEEAIQNGVCYRLINLFEAMQDSKESKKNQTNLIFATNIVNVSMAHIRLVTLRIFRESLRTTPVTCANLIANMNKLCLIYALNVLYDDMNSCFESGYFGARVNYSGMVLEAIKQSNQELRP